MSSTWVTFLFIVWGVGAIVSGVYDGIASFDVSHFNAVLQFDIFREADINILITHLRFPIPNFDWFKHILLLLVWDSSLWSGWANYIRIIVPLSFSAGMLVPMVLQLLFGRINKA